MTQQTRTVTSDFGAEPAGAQTAGVLAPEEGEVKRGSAPADDGATREVEVLILGGGVCGVGAGIALKRAQIDDFLILERAEELGGTWHHNGYPGCACDVPSHLYSFSFAMNPDWSRVFAEQPEIKRYVMDTATDHDLTSHVRFGTEVLEARWEEATQRWTVDTNRGRFTSRFFIVAAGPLHEPVIPPLPGLSRFQGAAFHSSRWPRDLDLTGQRVAVVGTGASAIQFVPRIQPQVERMTIFQRTPPWVMPKPDWRISRIERRVLRRLPFLMRVARVLQWIPFDLMVSLVHHPRLSRMAQMVGRLHMRRAIKDRGLRRRLTPDYVMGCKRVGLANDYYPALAQPNVELVCGAVEEVRERSVIAADGTEHEVDTIIFGTGFHVLTTHPVAARIRGRKGQTLAEYWHGSPRGYMGTTISGFPNAFMMFGPNIGTVSGFVMAEAQLGYIMEALRTVRREGLASIEVREEAQDAFTAEVDRALEGTVFLVGGCNSYYLDETGRVALAWPWTMARMRRRLSRFRLDAYDVRMAEAARAVA